MENSNIFTSLYWHQSNDGADESSKNHIIIGNEYTKLYLTITHKFGVRVAELAGEPIIQYNDFFTTEKVNFSSLSPIIKTQLQQNNIDLLYLHNVKINSNLYKLVKHDGISIAAKYAPYIDLSSYNNLDDYLAGLSAKTRKSKRRVLKKIQSAHDVEFNSLTNSQISPQLFDQVIQLKQQQLDRAGLTSRLFKQPNKIHKLKSILLNPNKDFQCIFSILKCDGKLAAAEIGYLKSNTYYSFLGAMSQEFQSYSPGSCQLLKTIEWAINNNVKTFDLLAPADDYKLSWTANVSEPVADYILPLTKKGEWGGELYFKTLRPLLKRGYLYLNSK